MTGGLRAIQRGCWALDPKFGDAGQSLLGTWAVNPKQLKGVRPVATASPYLLLAGLPSTPFGGVITELRNWLDSEKIQPTNFRTVVGEAGLGFEITFQNADDADRFLERFSSLIVN